MPGRRETMQSLVSLFTEKIMHLASFTIVCGSFVSLYFACEQVEQGARPTASIAATKASHGISNVESSDIASHRDYCTGILMAKCHFLHGRLLCRVSPEEHLL